VPNAAQFAAQLSRVGFKINLATDTVVTETGRGIRRSVASRTPVLSGRAQASWNLSVGGPDTSEKGPTYNRPGNSIDAGNVNVSGFRLGQNLFISNSIDYIDDLNAGSSSKAPAAFVEMTLANLAPILARAVVAAKAII